jgi:mannose-6-phosphate isomerase-like protein (cupin superfamily)
MKNLTRRDLCASLPALALFASAMAEGQITVADPVAALTAGPETIPPHSRTYAYDDLPSFKNPTGAITRTVMQGTLPTGEFIEIHETVLHPGERPHLPHRHKQSEWMLVREGSVEFQIGETDKQQVGPGGVSYAASGELHGVMNTGTVPALYFVFAVGKHIPM